MHKTLIALSLAVAVTTFAEIRPLMVGDSIPESALTTVSGESFDLAATVRQQPTAIIFYRGGWCPYCNLQLGKLQEIDPQLRALGYRIIAISPDRPEKLKESVEKEGMTYTLLSDASIETAKAFGIAFKVDDKTLERYKGHGIDLVAASGEDHNMLPVPAVFLVGKDGIIDFAHVDPNYRVRLDPDVLLAAAKAAAKPPERPKRKK